jgi:hypothetical protein
MKWIAQLGMQLLSIFSRTVNVVHGGKSNETFSERVERCKAHWYFNGWRVLINGFFRLFGQRNHTLMVTIDERLEWLHILRRKGYIIERPKQ